MKRFLFFTFFFFFLFSNLTAQVNQIWTDFNGFWTSSSSAINPIKPNNSHNLLAFRLGSTTFSTGVDDAKLIANGVSFSPRKFRAFPINSVPTSGTSYFAALGQLYDGVNNGASADPNHPFVANSPTAWAGFLTDGVQGLDMGTGLANIPAGSILQFNLSTNGITPSAIGDGIPDIVFVQIASPSAGGDRLRFVNASGTTVGSEVTFNLTNTTNFPVVGNWTADFYDRNRVLASGFTNTDRPIAVLAMDLSELGITAANYTNAARLVYTTGGTADPAFIAFNEPSVSVATYLAVTSQPVLYNSGSVLPSSITVEVRDGNGAVIQQSGIPVTASISTGSGALSGTLTQNTNASGVATFNNLVITGSGDHTLAFSSASLTTAVTAVISDGAVGGFASPNQVILTGTAPADINLVDHSGSIQWEWASTPTGSFSTISGATGTVLTSAQMGNLSASRYYRARVEKLGTTAYSNLVHIEPGTVVQTSYEEGGNSYRVVTFTAPGVFTVPSGVTSIDYLLVAGGGGGGRGSNRTGGGGSGGQVLTGTMLVSPGQDYSVFVGAGGSGGTNTAPASGGYSSQLGVLMAQGGGRGGQASVLPGSAAYGGGNHHGQNGVSGTIIHRGGNGYDQGFTTGVFSAGGGGGAGAEGTNASSSKAGNGGNGVTNALRLGTPLTYGGGGAGGFQRGAGGTAPTALMAGEGGAGGGGNGGWTLQSWTTGGSPSGSDGTQNSGGGGGGAAIDARNSIISGGNGGSGLVVIRYINPATLPVAWGDFTAMYNRNSKKVDLLWETQQEWNTDHFVVSVLYEQGGWTDVEKVAAAGNSSIKRTYQYFHKPLQSGVVAYRIKQVDLDGKFTYTPIRSIVWKSTEEQNFRIFPNPVAQGILRVEVSKTGSFLLFNAQGARIWEKVLPEGVHQIPISSFPKGWYVLQSENQSVRFVVQ